MSQEQQIRQHLESGRPITAMDALNRYGCFRLAARIEELRKGGLPVETRTRELENGKRVAEYWMQSNKHS